MWPVRSSMRAPLRSDLSTICLEPSWDVYGLTSNPSISPYADDAPVYWTLIVCTPVLSDVEFCQITCWGLRPEARPRAGTADPPSIAMLYAHVDYSNSPIH